MYGTQIIAAALLAYQASAVSQAVEPEAAGYLYDEDNTYYSWEQLTVFDETIEGDWWNGKYKPMLDAKRDLVYQLAYAEVEAEMGQLLETCDEGTKCRDDILVLLKEELNKQWSMVIQTLKKEVEMAVKETWNVTETAWGDLVQCEIDFPCCEYPEDVYAIKIKQKLYSLRMQIFEEYYAWYSNETYVVQLKTLCPPQAFDLCATGAYPSWDGTDRNDDYMCTPQTNFYNPACPNTLCWDGRAPSEVDCSCQNDANADDKVTTQVL